jgi:hypothetical protein
VSPFLGTCKCHRAQAAGECAQPRLSMYRPTKGLIRGSDPRLAVKSATRLFRPASAHERFSHSFCAIEALARLASHAAGDHRFPTVVKIGHNSRGEADPPEAARPSTRNHGERSC